ncbi:MAG: hypothetical protein V4561_10770 [Bacteroidota bacterium]
MDLYLDIQNLFRFSSEGISNYTFKRNSDNTDFVTTDGQSIKSDGNNAIPVLLNNDNSTFVPTIGFIMEF